MCVISFAAILENYFLLALVLYWPFASRARNREQDPLRSLAPSEAVRLLLCCQRIRCQLWAARVQWTASAQCSRTAMVPAEPGLEPLVWIQSDRTKGSKPMPGPLAREAFAVIRQPLGRYREFVFTYTVSRFAHCKSPAGGRHQSRLGSRTSAGAIYCTSLRPGILRPERHCMCCRSCAAGHTGDGKRYDHFTPGHLVRHAAQFGTWPGSKV